MENHFRQIEVQEQERKHKPVVNNWVEEYMNKEYKKQFYAM